MAEKIVQIADVLVRSAGDLNEKHLMFNEILISVEIECDVGHLAEPMPKRMRRGFEQRITARQPFVLPRELIQM